MQKFISEYTVRIIVQDIPQDYHYYDQQQVIKILKSLKALKKPYVYEVNAYTLH